jgi:putative isomerase
VNEARSGARSSSVFGTADERQAAGEKLLAYVHGAAPSLLRPPKGILAHPSIALSAPGLPYSEAMWDWDTLISAEGLLACAKLSGDAALHDRIVEHTRGSWLNFVERQSPEGRLPIMVAEADGDPFRCLEVAPRPNHRNQAKPVFGAMARLVADETGDVTWLAPHFDKLLAFYDAWTRDNLTGLGLLVWGDDVAIGNDNDPATFGRPFFSSANLLLNTLYNLDLRAAADLARRLGRTADAESLDARAEAVAEAIRTWCWDPRDRFFYTVDVQCVDKRAELIKYPRGMDMSWRCLPMRIQSFTGFLPLWAGIATQEQADALVRSAWLADDRFRAEWGARSLSNLETMYELVFSSNPSDWLGPVWPIVNHVIWRGLERYGFAAEAADLADRAIRLMATGLEAQGAFNEYYHPDTGSPMSHVGYMDWNMLVLEML